MTSCSSPRLLQLCHQIIRNNSNDQTTTVITYNYSTITTSIQLIIKHQLGIIEITNNLKNQMKLRDNFQQLITNSCKKKIDFQIILNNCT